MDFFTTAGRNLLAAEAEAGVGHHIALSVVGTERLQASGYFRAKLGQEELIKASPTPWTILRSTQFFGSPPSTSPAIPTSWRSSVCRGPVQSFTESMLRPTLSHHGTGATWRV